MCNLTLSWPSPERRHGSTRVPGHAFLAWGRSWRMVVYIYYITAAGISISSAAGQLLPGQPVRYGKCSKYGPSTTYKITPAGSLSFQPARRAAVLGQPVAYGLICHHHRAPVLSFTGPWIPNTGLFLTNIQRQPNQTTGALLHYPVKASGDLKKDNCLLLPYISSSIQNCLCKNSTMHCSR